MKIVYVKHYLNSQGIDYFQTVWFPNVHNVISKQKGFISIDYSPEKNDKTCINIVLKFIDEDSLQAWVKTKDHDELVDLLDPYRVKDWLWASVEVASEQERSQLVWHTAVPRTVVYDR